MALERPVAWLGAVLLCSCSAILDFDQPLTDGGPEPPDGGPDGAPVVDAGPDPNEPNNDFATATLIVPGSYGPLAISPLGDTDYFRFTMTELRDVLIDCNFAWMDGDLDLYLFNSGLMQIDQATHFDQDEHIMRTAGGANQLAPGDYYIRVEGFGGNFTNTYTLVLTVL